MAKIIEKIKNLFSGKYIYKLKCRSKKQEDKSKQATPGQQKLEEQK